MNVRKYRSAQLIFCWFFEILLDHFHTIFGSRSVIGQLIEFYPSLFMHWSISLHRVISHVDLRCSSTHHENNTYHILSYISGAAYHPVYTPLPPSAFLPITFIIRDMSERKLQYPQFFSNFKKGHLPIFFLLMVSDPFGGISLISPFRTETTRFTKYAFRVWAVISTLLFHSISNLSTGACVPVKFLLHNMAHTWPVYHTARKTTEILRFPALKNGLLPVFSVYGTNALLASYAFRCTGPPQCTCYLLVRRKYSVVKYRFTPAALSAATLRCSSAPPTDPLLFIYSFNPRTRHSLTHTSTHPPLSRFTSPRRAFPIFSFLLSSPIR